VHIRLSRPTVLAAGALALISPALAAAAPRPVAPAAPVPPAAAPVPPAAAPALAAAAAGTAAPPVTPPAAAPGPGSPVLLITGDRLLAAPSGGGMVAPARPGSLISLRAGGRSYAIPATALPYLGRGLSLGLFDVGALRRAEAGGRLPVRLSYPGRRPALPGIRITRSAAGTAAGYLTASSARAFGAALAGRSLAGPGGLLRGGVSISLAGPAAARRDRPGFVMHTLTVTGTNLAGRPDTGDVVFVWNVDAAGRTDPDEAFNDFYHGVTRFSVPAGHYWAVGIFGDTAFGATAPVRLVVLPQLTVAANTTVHLAERAADSKVTMVTPRPAVPQSTTLYLVRALGRGPQSVLQFANFHSAIWVSPTARRPTVGWIRADASQELTSPPGPGTPYGYALSYAGPRGIIAAQRYVARAGRLATIRDSYYQPVRSPGYWAVFGSFPATFNGYTEAYPYPGTLPGRRTLYLGGSPAADWGGYYGALGAGNGYAGFEDFRAVRPGEHIADGWNSYPLHPAATVDLAPRNQLVAYLPSADRAGNTLTLDLAPFSGNEPGQRSSYGFLPVHGVTIGGRYQVDQNGTRIAAGTAGAGPEFYTRVPLAAGPAAIRFLLTTARTGAAFGLSTATRTAWTWRSVPRPGARLPRAWYCFNPPAGVVRLPRRCAVQPMMTLRYQVARLAPDGSAPAGRQVLTITAAHLQLAQAAPVTGASLRVSFDGGATWRHVPVTGTGNGRYRAVFTAPAGASVTLRARARDAAGGSVTETITRGYAVAPRS